jgi:hypothetical protein
MGKNKKKLIGFFNRTSYQGWYFETSLEHQTSGVGE